MTSRTRTVVGVLGVLLLIFLGALGYAYFIEPQRLVINTQALRINGWDPEFDDFRAVLISDIHGGSNGVDEAKIHQIVEAANSQDADIIVLLGDFVSPQFASSEPKMPMAEVADALSGLRAKDGVYAVLGNHDTSYGEKAVASELTRVGIRVLDGEVAFIERGGKRVRLLGLEDHMSS